MPTTAKKRSTRSRTTRATPPAGRQQNNRSGPDAISFLKQDHRNVRALLRRFESDATEALLDEIEQELKVHTQIEEEIFYPAFKDAVAGKEEQEKLYYEALQEHHVVDLVLPDIRRTSDGSGEFGARARVLKDLVEHHADQEETNMFPKAHKAMSAAELRNLGMRLHERKQQLIGAGGTGTFERLLKPILGSRNKPRRSAA